MKVHITHHGPVVWTHLPQKATCSFIHPALYITIKKINTFTNSDYQTYLLKLLGREPSPSELHFFERNQDLLRIYKRQVQNDAYHITFTNGTEFTLLSDGIVRGGAVQLHSQQEGHRFYSVFFEEDDIEEEHCLMLNAKVEKTSLNGCTNMLVQGVQLITIEELVFCYNPIMYFFD